MLALGVAVQPLTVPFAAMPWIEPGSLARDIWSQGWPTTWPAEIAAHLTMAHGLFPNGVLPNVCFSFLGAAWSLSTEWQFYVLALLLGRSRIGFERLAAVFLLLAVIGLAVGPRGTRDLALQPGIPAEQGALLRDWESPARAGSIGARRVRSRSCSPRRWCFAWRAATWKKHCRHCSGRCVWPRKCTPAG